MRLGVRGQYLPHLPKLVIKRHFDWLLVAEAGIMFVDVLEHELLADADFFELLRRVHQVVPEQVQAAAEVLEAKEADRPAALSRSKDFPRQLEPGRFQARVCAALETHITAYELRTGFGVEEHFRPRGNVFVIVKDSVAKQTTEVGIVFSESQRVILDQLSAHFALQRRLRAGFLCDGRLRHDPKDSSLFLVLHAPGPNFECEGGSGLRCFLFGGHLS